MSRRQDEEILHEKRDDPIATAEEIPFDPWGDEEDPIERRRDPLRSPATNPSETI